MNKDINTFKKSLEDVSLWLSKEFSAIRTGRATVTLLDDIFVEAYGSKSPINQNASINVEDPKTIKITPWDKGLIKEIESAITRADLGVSTNSSSDGVRVIFPDLTSETRDRLVKQASKKLEEAKISARNDRAETIKFYEKEQKEGRISEDDLKRKKDEIQKMVDEKTKELDEKMKLKEKEIMA